MHIETFRGFARSALGFFKTTLQPKPRTRVIWAQKGLAVNDVWMEHARRYGPQRCGLAG